jgi:ABC-type uncharacterized transport system fused permease/ATPase subunit
MERLTLLGPRNYSDIGGRTTIHAFPTDREWYVIFVSFTPLSVRPLESAPWAHSMSNSYFRYWGFRVAEEIGFYRGHEYEKNVVERGYYGLVKHMNRVLRIRVWHGIVEEGIVKWVSNLISLVLGHAIFVGLDVLYGAFV